VTARESWVDAAGCRVLVRQIGNGTPTLLIQGLGCNTKMWAPVERAWPQLRLVSFDAPGAGRSPNRIPPPSITRLARLAAGLLDSLGLHRVDVVGYSFGGTVAQALARLAPQRVRRLVLVATAPGWGCVPGGWASMIHLCNPLRYYSSTYYQRTIGVMAGGQARDDPGFVARHAVDRLAGKPPLAGYYSQLAAASSWSSLSWLHEVAAPTLVVAGGDDRLLPPVNSVILARRIRTARLQVYPTEGHLMLFDESSPALPGIAEFLTMPTLDESLSWRDARTVTRSDEEAAVRGTRRGLFPWGLASAAYRSLHTLSARWEGAPR
jgi:poly(3-hydroxyoctanoate) depolymerase